MTRQFQFGAVGYFYKQLSRDTGAGNRGECFGSRVAGIGPQIGHIVPLGEHYQGYFNLEDYKEFADEHRASGWNVWLTFAVAPTAPDEAPQRAPMIRK